MFFLLSCFEFLSVDRRWQGQLCGHFDLSQPRNELPHDQQHGLSQGQAPTRSCGNYERLWGQRKQPVVVSHSCVPIAQKQRTCADVHPTLHMCTCRMVAMRSLRAWVCRTRGRSVSLFLNGILHVHLRQPFPAHCEKSLRKMNMPQSSDVSIGSYSLPCSHVYLCRSIQ